MNERVSENLYPAAHMSVPLLACWAPKSHRAPNSKDNLLVSI